MGTYGMIDFDEEEIDAAGHWYGGQGSMLYAIMSTGSLRRGTIRPRHPDGTQMTDDEWIVDLAERLESEAEDAAKDAAKQAKKAKGDEKKELLADIDGLRGIAHKAQQFVKTKQKQQPSTRVHHAAKRKTSKLVDDAAAAYEVVDRLKRKPSKLVADAASAYEFVDRLKHGHRTTKSPAQLQREIDEVLANTGSSSSPKRSHATIKSSEPIYTLSGEELVALRAFAKANGRSWKSKLNDAWMTGHYDRYSGTDDYGTLQWIRNRFGPSWLVKFAFDRPKTHTVKH